MKFELEEKKNIVRKAHIAGYHLLTLMKKAFGKKNVRKGENKG